MAELFTEARYSGAAVSRAVAAIVFGGCAPFIAVILSTSAGGDPWPVALYVIVLATITFVAGWLAHETSRRRLSESAPH